MLNKTDLLLPEVEITKLPYSLRTVADAASLHTAKVILDAMTLCCLPNKEMERLERFCKLERKLEALIKEVEQK